MRSKLFIFMLLPILLLHCGTVKKDVKVTPEPARVDEEWINTGEGLVQEGIASWYGGDFHGRRTANGEIYDMEKLTAAHKYLPFHTLVEVENLDNDKIVLVRINDRGPFVKGRVIDLSRKAARRIEIEEVGTARVRLRIVKASDIATIPKNTPTGTNSDTNINKNTKPGPVQEKAVDKEEISVTEVKETGAAQTAPAIPPEPPPTVQSEKNETFSGYYLQAGAFSSMKNAKRLLRHIKQLLPGVSFNIEYKEGLYKLLSVNLGSRDTAETFKKYLHENDIEAFIKDGTD